MNNLPRGAETPATPRRQVFRLVREAVIVLAVALVLSTLIRTFLFEQFRVPSTSMATTIQAGDRIGVLKPSAFERGSVVVFVDNLNWLSHVGASRGPFEKAVEFIGLAPSSRDDYLVKRIVGLPGDRVACCTSDGRLTVNGVAADEPYVSGDKAAPQDFDVTVPAGRVFVLGDNRPYSADSRHHLCTAGTPTPDLAFPSLDDVLGPVTTVVWPPSHWSGVDATDAFAQVPDPGPAPPKPIVDLYPTCEP